MSSSLLTVLFTLTILFNIFTTSVEAIKSFKVGDSEGWQHPGPDKAETYTQWTSGKKFHVGDSLRFEYKNDSVLVVDKWGYYHCEITNPSSVFIDGNTTLVLDNPGKFYFISGDPQHCKKGQRLSIKVFPLPLFIATDPLPYFNYPPSPAPPSPAMKSGSSAVSVSLMSLVVVVCVAISGLAWFTM